MKIPNDTGGNWRAKKFVEYANFVPPVHQSFLTEYAERRNLNEEQCILLAFLMGDVYSELTAIFMLEEWNYSLPTKEQVALFLEKWNDTIIYGSARKWMRYNGRTQRTLEWLIDESKNGVYSWFKSISSGSTEREIYDNIQSSVLKCPEYGRFASDLFNEILMVFNKSGRVSTKLRSNESINFYDGNNLTSGLFNIIYMDDRADDWDIEGKLSQDEFELLSVELLKLKDLYEQTYNTEIDVPLFVTKICSFRNCFKGKRGGGYHHYRQLKYLRHFETIAPAYQPLWDECYDIRQKVYPSILRGEDHGIVGIPPSLTKWWLTNGWVGCEPEALASIRSSSLDEFFK